TMEYVDGTSLYKWMKKKGKLGLGSVVRILSLLCHALEHAHQYAVHRDLSPDNVMVLANGNIKLLDFGLAKLTNVESQFTMIGVSLGKQQYMAPEQRMSAAEVDKRADIYSLGVMFYELLTGQLPKGDIKITDLVPELSTEANSFVAKAMAKDPTARYQDAREFRQALAQLYKSSTGVAIPGSEEELVQQQTPLPVSGGDATPIPVEPTHQPPDSLVSKILNFITSLLKRK
ncbi:MAG TPA: serine/threonine-protein kinase, partial [Candidatus Hydrogenedentes bacterium]|nr:serine/threonine-protein kinase [Candidatus Hydrogenedentota bacterium]